MKGAVIASGEFQLIPIDDGLGISLTSPSCIVKAGFDGSNPDLSQATTEISLLEGGIKTYFELSIIEVSNPLIGYDVTNIDEYTVKLSIKGLPTDILSGHIKFRLTTKRNRSIDGVFSISVIRESTMLDWIQDWDSNKTQVGSSYLISPKIFVGKRVAAEEGQLGQLTGVYIGPDTDKTAGIYGYKEGNEIFHINEKGGSLGGWNIVSGGIESSDGLFQISSSGSIKVKDIRGNIAWNIDKSGNATFSKGKVAFNSDGTASFEGRITAMEGDIGGWIINRHMIRSDFMVIDSSRHYIGISPFDLSTLGVIDDSFEHISYVRNHGGVCMRYESANVFGIEGYLPAASSSSGQQYKSIFSLGSTNHISGWSILNNRLSTERVAIVSDSDIAGIYLSSQNIKDTLPSYLNSTISKNGGICLYSTTYNSELSGYQKDGSKIFLLSTSANSEIAGWSFNSRAIFCGTLAENGFTSKSGEITISKKGLRGYKWRFDADGSGELAGGNISWDTNGNVVFKEDTSIVWKIPGISDKLTKIDKNGIYTGTISADNITSGTISTVNIQNKQKTWFLNQDGSGALANGNISWDKDGDTLIKGKLEASGISMCNYAKLASAIFSGDYMFSQQGKNAKGEDSYDYNKFGTLDFTPNLSINLKTGEFVGNKCNLRGSLRTEMQYISSIPADGNVTIGNKNSDYTCISDSNANITLVLPTGPNSYGTTINLYQCGSGEITLYFWLSGSYFLYNGKMYKKIILNVPGSFISLKYMQMSPSIAGDAGIGFFIQNSANLVPSSIDPEALSFKWK